MKKILQCITLSEAGGAQQIVKALCEGFCEENNIILATAPNGELYNWAKSRGVRTYSLKDMGRSISPLNDIKTLIQLIRIISHEKPDIVHCHSWKAGVLGRIAAFLCGVKEIYFTVHGWSLLSYSNSAVKAVFILIEKLLALMTTKLICVCEEDRKLGIDLKIAEEEKFNTVYNGISDIRNLGISDIREKYSIPDNAILIGSVARLAQQKRCLETVHIMSGLMKERKDIYFIYVGDGPLYGQMDGLVKELGLSDRFILAGNQNNVPEYLKAIDVFLLLSNYEGLPVSILEAMSIGLPIIASNVGGVCELVEDGRNGFLVSNDEVGIIEKISTLLNNDKMRINYGKNSREVFEYRFTVNRMISGYKELFGLKSKMPI